MIRGYLLSFGLFILCAIFVFGLAFLLKSAHIEIAIPFSVAAIVISILTVFQK